MAAEIGIGLAALGRPGYINLGHANDLAADYSVAAMQRNAYKVLDAAWDEGLRYFDAARSYGRAEEFLAGWISLRNFNPNELRVGSKWGYVYTADWAVQTPPGVQHEVKRHDVEVLQKQFSISQQFFGDHLNLYQIHSATLHSGVLENQPVLECLAEMRSRGLEIGLSVSGVDQSAVIEKAISIEFDDERLFSSVQATWNLLERSAGLALQKAYESGMRVIVKEALANGRLTRRNHSNTFAAAGGVLDKIADQIGTDWDAIAIAAVMNQPWAATVLSGAASVDHVKANAKAKDVVWTLAMEQELKKIAQLPADYWQQRSELVWN